jgi:hypothetical protein
MVKKEEAPTGGRGLFEFPMGGTMQWAVIHWPGAACSTGYSDAPDRKNSTGLTPPFARRDRQSAGKSFRLSLLLR